MASALLKPTELVYLTYEGCWQMECTGSVLSVNNVPHGAVSSSADDDPVPLSEQHQRIDIILDRTVLHAQGGGQPTDTGRIVVSNNGGACTNTSSSVDIIVSKVTLDRATGLVLHTGRAIAGTPIARLPSIGDTVRVLVDADQRRILSECHTAGHVVDAAMARCGKLFPPTKGYHFLDGPYVEYAGTIAVDERDTLLLQLQEAFRQLVADDIATKIDIVDQEQADRICNRLLVPQNKYFDVTMFADANQQVRVVTVADFPCPCGGTHVRSTADLAVNGWGISGIKSKKGIVRIKYGPQKTPE